MQKRNLFLSILIFSLLLVGIFVYADEYSINNPGHSWDEMDCDTTMCVGKNNAGDGVAGNVGVGTKSPNAPLEVKGYNGYSISIVAEGTIYAGYNLGVGNNIQLAHGKSIYFEGSTMGSDSASLYTDTNNRLKVRSEDTYNVAQFASYGLYLPQDTDYSLYTGGGAHFNYNDSGDEVIIQNGTGYVGIGTTSPINDLDVRGYAYVSNRVSSGGNIQASTSITSYVGVTAGIELGSLDGQPMIRTSQTAYSDGLTFRIGGGSDGVPGIFFRNSTGVNNAVLYASAKNFLIDHPLKPEMKLIHSAIEGPENAVYYRGEARLKNGKAVVKLPSYFEALTRKENRTVLLTCKDGWTPIWVEDEVRDGKFIVRTTRGGDKNQKFYWEVKAVRADIAPLKVERKASDFESK